MLECVVNISEGRRLDVVELIARNAGGSLLDAHSDPDHNRTVLTLAGESSARAVATAAVLALDIGRHTGAHPRFGVVDVVPFVPLGSSVIDDALAARDRFAAWLASELGVPCFLYGPQRSLPEVRRGAFTSLAPDVGPAQPHPTAGACAVGAREVMLAYNLWLAQPDLAEAERLARSVRRPEVRALALPVGGRVQVSMNLIAPASVGPAQVFDAVAAQAAIDRAELVGLAPRAVLEQTDPARWAELDLSPDRTIERRCEAAGIDLDAPG
jgi:glutamate formiminotransferase / 5-formyltetrahydrofolate cyclo-ligase